MTEGNGWNEYQQLVLQSLDRLEKVQQSQGEQITDLKVDIGQLKVKASVWGGIGGVLSGIVTRFIPGPGGH